jgi:hypothetical protein
MKALALTEVNDHAKARKMVDYYKVSEIEKRLGSDLSSTEHSS